MTLEILCYGDGDLNASCAELSWVTLSSYPLPLSRVTMIIQEFYHLLLQVSSIIIHDGSLTLSQKEMLKILLNFYSS